MRERTEPANGCHEARLTVAQEVKMTPDFDALVLDRQVMLEPVSSQAEAWATANLPSSTPRWAGAYVFAQADFISVSRKIELAGLHVGQRTNSLETLLPPPTDTSLEADDRRLQVALHLMTSLCWFCMHRPPDDASREEVLFLRRSERLSLFVPSCAICSSRHKKEKELMRVAIPALIPSFLFVPLVIFHKPISARMESGLYWALVCLTVVSGAIGWFLFWRSNVALKAGSPVRSLSTAARVAYPEVFRQAAERGVSLIDKTDAHVFHGLQFLYTGQRPLTQADAEYASASANVLVNTLGEHHPFVVYCQLKLAAAYEALADTDKAQSLRSRANAALATYFLERPIAASAQ
jgi:hypothetical protein